MKTRFIVRSLVSVFALTAATAFAHRADTPAANSADSAWMARHAEKVAALADGTVKKDIVFIGDELTADWETTGAAALATYFTGDKTMFNLGYAGDCTEHVLWRIQNGEIGNPKAIFLMVGGNNTATYTESEEARGLTTIAVRKIIDYIRSNHGSTKLVVQAILPRGADESDPVRARNDQVNNDIRKYAQSAGCTWVDMSDLFLESDHHTLKTSLYNVDKATLNASGYAAWAQAVQDYVTAAVNGTAMPSDLVATARPAGVSVAAYPSFSTAVMDNFFWEKYNYDMSAIRGHSSYDIVLLGDSITEKWSSTDSSSMSGLGANVFNLGRTGDFTENLNWRLSAGCLDGYTTKFFNLLIGTNNSVQRSPMDAPADIAAGVKAVLDLVLAKHPESKVLLMPILPYGYTNAQNNATGMAVYANNEAANEIIKTYADGERVILVDVRSQFLNANKTFKGEMYLERNGDYPDMFLHLSAKGYSEIIAPAIKSAMQLAGASSVALPSVGSVAVKVTGTSATLTLSGIVKGTDASGTAASSYKVTYKLDTAAETTLATDETGDSATVALTDLTDGWHTCAVAVSADGVVKSEVKRVKFQIDTNADKVGWKVAPMTEDSAAIRDDGTKVFAIAKGSGTFNGVEFSARNDCSDGDNLSVSPANDGNGGWGLGVQNNIINNYWLWNSSGNVTFTFKGLTSGRKYLAQIVASRYHTGDGTTISAGDITPVLVNANNDYKYGAVITRVFEASGAQENIVVGFSNAPFEVKAVQLRDLGAGSEEDPTHEDDPVDPPAGTAWIPDPVPGSNPASEPCIANERTDDYHKQHFAEDLSAVEKSHKNFDVVLFGDSITDFWVNPNLSLDEGLTNTVNMGIGSDRTQNLLWRVRNGALDGYTTKYLTLLIGVNNSHQKRIDENIPCDRPEDIADSIRLILNEMVAKHPESKILLMPIIPYCYDSRYYDGLEVRNTNEDVNDYIIKFVDNKRIFWVDFRRQFLNSDATCNHSWYRDGGNPGGGYDAVGTCLHPAIASYSDIFKPALSSAIQKYLAVPAGTAQVADPSLGYASAAPDGMDQSATITVCGIFLGTDSSAKPVTSYTLAYDLDNGKKVGELTNQTLTRNSFKIADVGPGDHTCAVTITTADGKVLTTSVDFAMTEGWTGAPLPADSGAVRTDGTLKYAYAVGNYTVNDVSFTAARTGVDDDHITWPYASDSSSPAPTGVEAGGYSDLLTHCWWANQGEKTVTLKNLKPGENYLVQIFGYRNYNGFDKSHVWIKESFRDVNFIKVMGDGWTYGGVLTGVFTATAETKTFTIVADSNYAVNGIQVRDIGQGTIEPIPVNPSIGSVSASVSGSTATISLKNIVKGTDDEAVAATSYSVAYTLNGAAAVTALSNQSAATAQFDISNLADGDYTCLVTITTDKSKTSVAKSVNFTIKTSTPGGDDDPDEPVATGWTSEPMDSAGAKFSTKGSLKYAYACQGKTINTVAFTRAVYATEATNIAFAPAASGFSGDFMNEGVSGDFGLVIGNAWHWTDDSVETKTITMTLKGLTSGKKYLVQLLSHTMWDNNLVLSANGCEAQHVHGADEASGKYGALVTGVFTATAETHDVVLVFSGSNGVRPINAVQVRELGEGGDDPVTTVDPSIGSLTASVNGTVVTISLADIVFGTDDDGEAATSCSVYYSVTNSTGSEIKSGTVKSGLDAQTYAFDLNDFEDGDYTCGVMITTDKGKTASKTVGFTIEISTPGGDDDPEEPLPVYTLTIPVQDHLSVASVKTNNVAVTGSEGAYSIVSNTQVTITFAAATGYQITAGNPVVVTVESDMTLAEFPTVQEKQGGDDPEYELGWTAAAMTADPASVRKDGTLLYAYARFDATVNTVEFKGVGSSALAIDNDDVSWTGFNMAVASGSYPDVTDDYLTLLKSSWACMHTYTHSVTLKNLTIGKTYLVQFIGCRSDNSNDAEIYVGETEDTSIFMKAGGTGWPYGGTLVGIFKAEATTKVVDLKFVKMSQDWTSWNAVQVRELGAVGPTPADAPIIGGEGVDVPMAVSSDTVSITISNAAVGHTYGYKKSTTLEGLETAEVIKLDSPAAVAGILTLDIPKDPEEPTCFYQIVVD